MTTHQSIINMLTFACEQHDLVGLQLGMKQAAIAFGDEALKKAMLDLMKHYDWLWTEAFSRMPEDQQQVGRGIAMDTLAEIIEKAGLRLEDNLRISDDRIALTHAAVRIIKATGFPKPIEGNDSLQGMGIDRRVWIHPLADIKEADGEEWMNSWAAACLAINAAQGWMEDGEAGTPEAMELVKNAVITFAPTTNAALLVRRARYDDGSLLKLTEYVSRWWSLQAEKAIERNK